jgi:hypothetical protein
MSVSPLRGEEVSQASGVQVSPDAEEESTSNQTTALSLESTGHRWRERRWLTWSKAPRAGDEEWDQFPESRQPDIQGTVLPCDDEFRSAASAPAPEDCCGVASKYVAAQRTFVVNRVPERRQGYCARSNCECCAPNKPSVWCSCRATKDGLCRRCWLDAHCGKERERGSYTGPALGDVKA